MATNRADVIKVIERFMGRISRPVTTELSPVTELYSTEGLGLDSLETAELSAVLEDEFSSDPFSTDELPQTIGDLLDYFETVAADG